MALHGGGGDACVLHELAAALAPIKKALHKLFPLHFRFVFAGASDIQADLISTMVRPLGWLRGRGVCVRACIARQPASGCSLRLLRYLPGAKR